MAAWKAALKECYAVYDAVPVCWEVVRRSGTRAGHTQTQVVPVPKDRLEGLESYVRDAAQEDGIDFESDDVVEEFASGESADRCSMITAADREDFFSLEINGRRLLWLLRGRRFNLQFPRYASTHWSHADRQGDARLIPRHGRACGLEGVRASRGGGDRRVR